MRNQEKTRLSRACRKHLNYFVMFSIALIFLFAIIPFSSALFEDKIYNPETKTATIRSWLNNPIADIQLVSNTEQCLIDCSAIIKITPLIDLEVPLRNTPNHKWEFLNKKNKNAFGKEISEYKISIQQIEYYNQSINDYGECKGIKYRDKEGVYYYDKEDLEMFGIDIKNTIEEEYNYSCVVGSHLEERKRKIWQEIKANNKIKLQKGKPELIKLEGKKKFDSSVEWIPTFYNVKINEWAWWNSSWDYKEKLTFDNSASSENLIDFPAIIKLNSSRIDYSNLQNDGDDLRFIDANNTTELNFHIENWNASGDSFIWVKIPQIDAGSTTNHIWIYYGNADASNAEDEAGTYDDNYIMVQHFNEEGWANDSTSNSNDGDITALDWTAFGKIGGTYESENDDGSQYIIINHSASFDLENGTISFWVNLKDLNADTSQFIMNKVIGSYNDNFRIWAYGLARYGTRYDSYSPQNLYHIFTDTYLSDDTWYYITITWDDSYYRIYRDGIERDSTSVDMYLNASNNDADLIIFSSYNLYGVNGSIDEIRWSNTSRSAEWIEAVYLSESDDFLSFGEEILGCGTINEAGTYILKEDLSSEGNCFNITTSNVIIDCQGHTINYSSGETGYGIETLGGLSVSNITIKNCIIQQTNSSLNQSGGIIYRTANQSIIQNCTITTNGYESHAIYLDGNYSNFDLTVINNTLTTTGEKGWNVYVSGIINSTITNNTMSASALNGRGISIWETRNSNITGNNITTEGISGHCFIFSDSPTVNIYDNLLTNNNCTTSGNSASAIFSYSNTVYNNTFRNNIIKTTGAGSAYGLSFSNIYNNYFYNTNINASQVADVRIGGSGTNYLINPTFDKNISVDAGTTGDIYIKYYLDVYVNDTLGNTLENANVTAWDKNDDMAFTELTNASGYIEKQALTEFYENITNRYYLTNYSVKATDEGFSSPIEKVNLTENKEIVLTVDKKIPIVDIISPTGTYFTYSLPYNISLNYSATDDHLDSCWYLLDNNYEDQDEEDAWSSEGNFDPSHPNSSAVDEDWNTYASRTGAGTSYIYENYTINNHIEANWTAKFYVSTSAGGCVNQSLTYYWNGAEWKDTGCYLRRGVECTEEEIAKTNDTCILPSDALSGNILQLRSRVTIPALDGTTYRYYEGKVTWGKTLLPDCANTTINISTDGSHNITIYANDTTGNIGSDFTEFFINLLNHSEEYETENILETQSVLFKLFLNATNITTADANLTYNGTNYGYDTKSTSSTQANFTKTIKIPLVNSTVQNNTFYWNYIIDDHNNQTASHNQSVYKMILQNSDAGGANKTLQFYIKDEEDDAAKSGTLKGNFKIWLAQNSINHTNLDRTYGFDETAATTHSFYILPAWASYQTNSQLEYASTGYTTRNYYLSDATITNSSQNITLYVANATEENLGIVLIKVIDEYNQEITNAYIKILRYYPKDATYKTVEILKTDYYGQATARLVLYDVWYKFLVSYNGETIIETTPLKVVSNEMTLKKGAGEAVLTDWLNLRNVQYSLTYLNDSKTFKFVFTDTSGLVQEGCLRVVKRTGTKDTEICNECQESSAATITCTLPEDAEDTYVATGWFTINPTRSVTLWITITGKKLAEYFGKDGILIGLLLVITCAAVGIWSAPVAIAMSIVGLITALMLGFVMMSYAAIISIVLVGIILLIKMKQ